MVCKCECVKVCARWVHATITFAFLHRKRDEIIDRTKCLWGGLLNKFITFCCSHTMPFMLMRNTYPKLPSPLAASHSQIKLFSFKIPCQHAKLHRRHIILIKSRLATYKEKIRSLMHESDEDFC